MRIKVYRSMNFKTISIIILISSTIFSKSIIRERNMNQIIIQKNMERNRTDEEIVNIDFEGNLNSWTQDVSNGWNLSSSNYNSYSHSYNSPDINNTGSMTTHSLYSEYIELPNLLDGEIIQYSFALDCDMPDFLQEDNPNTSDDESAYLADYYIVSVRDVNESAWHTSDFGATDGSNWWCADEEEGGYLDSWFQYLDTPSIPISGNNATLTVDMKWGIEDFENVSVSGTCADGWDQANVQVSTDEGLTWNVIEGSHPYDFQCGYGSISNGFEGQPGWGGIQDWHNVSFNLDDYIDETVQIRFAFYSDVAWSINDEPTLTGLQIDNIEISSDNIILFENNADNESNMLPSGSSWVDQLYDYCDADRPGYLSWEIYSPGDAFDGNILMDLTSFEGKTIQFRFQTIYDGNHFSSESNGVPGDGLYIDDLILYKKSTFNPIPPNGLTGYLNNDNIYILWNDLNVSGTGEFIYDNNIFSPDHFIVIDDNPQAGTSWAGTEIYTAGTSVVDSIYLYVFGAFDGELAGFGSFGSDYNISPEYNEDLSVLLLNENFELDLTEHTWVGIDVNNWTFYGSFIIGATLSENYPVGYDPTASPSSHSKILLGSGWEDWSDIVPTLNDSQISDGEWGLRAIIDYSSPEATYNIYRNNILIASGIQTFEYQDTNIESGNTYEYSVSATYPNGDESPKSEIFTITVEDCAIDGPGCSCSSCDSDSCILDCSLNCIDNNELSNYINDNNCDDGEENELNLFCQAFVNDGLDCIVDLNVNENIPLPEAFSLGQNFPNPFNPTTTIPFSIPELSNIDLTIYNVSGQEVYKKSFKGLFPGSYEYSWNGQNQNSGIYFYTLESNTGIYLKEKMLLIK